MITIKRDPCSEGFAMKFSAPGMGWRPFSVVAHNAEEIKHAVDHYYAESGGHPQDNPDCPLCRQRAKQSKKEDT